MMHAVDQVTRLARIVAVSSEGLILQHLGLRQAGFRMNHKPAFGRTSALLWPQYLLRASYLPSHEVLRLQQPIAFEERVILAFEKLQLEELHIQLVVLRGCDPNGSLRF